MPEPSEQSVSVWMDAKTQPEQRSLPQNMTVDVCVVGAGIAGMSTAYLLSCEGRKVVVLDDGPVGGGQTQRTTAHLSNALDDRYFEIERIHGEQGARLTADSHTAAIDRIETIITKEHIECDFERLDGYLFCPPGESPEILDRELAAVHRAGLKQVERLGLAPLNFFNTGPCLRFPRQGQFHPLKYLAGLSQAIHRHGGSIFCGIHVDSIEGGTPAQIKTHDNTIIKAGHVVVATNTPINDLVAIHTKQAPYLSYVIGVRIPKGSVTKALYWDTLDPYHYIRLQSGQGAISAGTTRDWQSDDLLIVGGEDHKTGQASDQNDRYGRLEAWARERFPMMGATVFRWSGQVMETTDGLAFIGRNPLDQPNVLIATGDSGMGMTHGTIAGILLTDLILGRQNPWEALYEPSRKNLWAAGEFAKENLNVLKQYGDWFTGGDVAAVAEIARGKGAVIRRGLSKFAVFHDEQGVLHKCSAVCPHLGCIVDWNDNEKTWDCPCHGSRFDKTGKVLNGPANSDLPAVKE